MKCENCPAGWEDRSYEGECYDCGCLILGHDMFDEHCRLSMAEIERRLKQLEDYHAGKIKRPKWVAERFMRELDQCFALFKLDLGIPSYPPKKTHDNLYYSLHGGIDMRDAQKSAYRQGYEDAKAGLECNPEKHYMRDKERL